MDSSPIENQPSQSTAKSGQPRVLIRLNGQWDVQPSRGLLIPPEWCYTVQVPGLVDGAEPAYDVQAFDCHWHRKTFDLPPESIRPTARLVLEQAMFGTEVWLNGRRLGGDIACYTSQVYDVPDGVLLERENVLMVCVGSRRTLPSESAVGKDQERETFIPGIWGDVSLILAGTVHITHVQVVPQVDGAAAELRVTVRNRAAAERDIRVSTRIYEKRSGRQASGEIEMQAMVVPEGETVITFHHGIRDMKLWSPESPFLYEVVAGVRVEAAPEDMSRTTFGMRSFAIKNGHFFLNGQRVFLRGGNIAFHRFLSDAERGTLPWDPAWIKRVLIDIPKAHNFNFFRNHLGQMYNRWYDIADEYGMLLQNEWQFWMATGTHDQILREFSCWVTDNVNHPSIVIWDALNESSDAVVQNEVVPAMKRLDPTRPWESVDFVEDHPYVYSLGPVLNDRKFGCTRSLEDIAYSPEPTVINEFLWWWLDRDGNPAPLTHEVVERWLGREYTQKELQEHQCFLARELVELFRRMRVDAVQPFVYLSNNAGPTAHWFSGPIAELHPKPILSALKESFAPFGLSVELWDRHFSPGEHRAMQLFIFNDNPAPAAGSVCYGVQADDGRWIMSRTMEVVVEASGLKIVPIVMGMPGADGRYSLRAELLVPGEEQPVAASHKPAFVVSATAPPPALLQSGVVVADGTGEVSSFVGQAGIPCTGLEQADLSRTWPVIVVEDMIQSAAYRSKMADLSLMVAAGGTLILLEPEKGVLGAVTIPILTDVDLHIRLRADLDKGGYDSYVFAEDHGHPLWRGITRDHLKMFNGAFGGEVVSQHDVIPGRAVHALARCGLKLHTPAVMEIPYGKGRVIVSRIQTRGRLIGSADPAPLYARRKDPVIQRYFFNLLSWAAVPRGGKH